MRTLIIFFILPLFFTVGLSAQGQTDTPVDSVAPPPPPIPPPGVKVAVPDTSDEVLVFAEEMPQFPGGQPAFQQFLVNNLHYPDSSLKYGREGTVYVYFEVAKDGSIGNVICKKGVPKAPDLCEEAVRIISIMPNWEPGKMNGRPVKVSMTVPVKFVLQ